MDSDPADQSGFFYSGKSILVNELLPPLDLLLYPIESRFIYVNY